MIDLITLTGYNLELSKILLAFKIKIFFPETIWPEKLKLAWKYPQLVYIKIVQIMITGSRLGPQMDVEILHKN